MERLNYINYITSVLIFIKGKVNDLGHLNLRDINIHSEYLFCDLLNLIFDDANFKNLNKVERNAVAIDLIDEKQKIIIQVSSSATRDKIRKTLSKNIIKKYAEQDYKLKFLFIKNEQDTKDKKLKESEYKNPHKIIFDFKTDILLLNDLVNEIMGLDVDKQKLICYHLEKETKYPLPFKEDDNHIYSEWIDFFRFFLKTFKSKKWIKKKQFYKTDNNSNLTMANINKKIQFNNLEQIEESRIKKNKEYIFYIERTYEKYSKKDYCTNIAIFNILKNFYYEEKKKNLEINHADIFENIINSIHENITESIKNITQSKSVKNKDKKKLEKSLLRLKLFSELITVHAFISCEIFEIPKEGE